MIVTKELLRNRFVYNNGNLLFRKSIGSRKAGDIAGTRNDGYINICINRKTLKAHRLIWVYHHGPIPAGFDIHHIDGSRDNNKIENLDIIRHKSHSKCHNHSSIKSNNKSGISGVRFRFDRGVWHANIKSDGHQLFLGSFDNLFDAACARKSAEIGIEKWGIF